MSSAKYTAMVLAVMFIALIQCASAQWSPGGNMVYMGDLNLAASSASSGAAPHVLGGPVVGQMNLNNSSMNATSLNNTTFDTFGTPSGLKPLDLSNYAKDRVGNNLAGYKNVMYPISGSRGTTTSTSGGGGCGGGCGA